MLMYLYTYVLVYVGVHINGRTCVCMRDVTIEIVSVFSVILAKLERLHPAE